MRRVNKEDIITLYSSPCDKELYRKEKGWPSKELCGASSTIAQHHREKSLAGLDNVGIDNTDAFDELTFICE